LQDVGVGFDFIGDEQDCAYLEDRKEKIHYKIITHMSKEQLSKYIQNGWRRFGALIHRPSCDNCKECQSLRVDVDKFKFSKSIRRVIDKNKDIRVFLGAPRVDKERVDLYNKYHKFMETKKGWEYKELTKEAYAKSFLSLRVEGAYEITYFLDDKLIGIDIVDIVNDGISSTYFVYDTDFRDRGLGNFSIYQNILIAKTRKLQWLYLGYYVKGCASLEYKSKFKPYKILQGRPDMQDNAIWSDVCI